MPDNASKMKLVYSVTERNGKKFWSRIGVAFVNSDGSLRVKLESLPLSGEMDVRDERVDEFARPSGGAPAKSEPISLKGIDQPALIKLCRQLVDLTDHLHPGLVTWNEACLDTVTKLHEVVTRRDDPK